jgi:hypothetical protein
MRPYAKILVNNIPYLRKKISILLTLSPVILLLLLTTSPLLLFNLQPIQASQPAPLSFRTLTPANGNDDCVGGNATLTFDAQGTASSSDSQCVDITSGTFQVTSIRDGQISYSGNIHDGRVVNNGRGGVLEYMEQ